MLYFSFFGGGAPSAGWFSYPPLTERSYSADPGITYWALSLLVIGLGSVATGINLIATIIALRAPGMTLMRVPLFVWMVLMTAILVILALPALNAAIVMILLDRLMNSHFFAPAYGGSALLWQHYFWFFGHPEVYILILPGFGVVTEVIPVFSRKVIYGAGFMAASSVAIAFLSFGLWIHHMFSTGLSFAVLYIFALSSLLIAVPTGIKVWNWIATMWGGSIRFTSAMLFATAFIAQFTIGGLSGVTFAVIPLDWQLTDSYFVVAHIHYVLLGGMMFAMISGIYYWYPKVTGRMLSEKLGKWHFWLMVIGFNGTFFVMHVLGVFGLPRRVWTYPHGLPAVFMLNLFSSLSAFVLATSIFIFIFNIISSFSRGAIAGDNPWEAWTLEWATSSPPAPHNFEMVPAVHSRRPLWDLTHNVPELSVEPTKIARIKEPAVLGMQLFVASEAVFFLLLVIAYLNFHKQTGQVAATLLDPVKTGAFSVALVLSSVTLWFAEKSRDKTSQTAFKFWLSVTILLGGTFLAGQAIEYVHLFKKNMTIAHGLFGSTFFTLTGFHGLHVTVGLLLIASLLGLSCSGRKTEPQTAGLRCVSIYWHFVDAVWLVIFSVVYLWRFV
ncbi:MAG TPA: cbb3-type cytochrome c oxidase subunit I, partial [Chroococcales cyanobacterium]